MPDLTTDRLDTIEVAAALPVYQTFTYSLPDDLIGLATPGMRVLVPFGRRNMVGIVVGVADQSEVPEERLLSVSRVLDGGERLLDEE